jgi:WhiB family redox-sensing transcriptional regulator
MRRSEERVTVVLVDVDRSEWRNRAVCSRGDVDPDLFFPVGSSGPGQRQIAAAKAVCRRCPVITPCLMWALIRDEDGVWGGLSVDERRAIRRRVAARRAEHHDAVPGLSH